MNRARARLFAVAAIAAAPALIAAAPASAATTHAQTAHPALRPTAGHPMIPGGPRGLVSPRTSHDSATSDNWSGYAAHSGTYTSVSSSWTEPTGNCSSGQDTYSSFWVGLDGYSSSSVEQDGSEVDCSGGSPQYYAWYEMYPAYPVNFSNEVYPGDHFTASVTYSGSNRYVLKIADTTRGWSHTINKTQSGLARTSAECIIEAPYSGGVLPLADFGRVNFTGCDANGSAIGNSNPTQITMVSNSGVQEDTISGLSSGANFSATWDSSGG